MDKNCVVCYQPCVIQNQNQNSTKSQIVDDILPSSSSSNGPPVVQNIGELCDDAVSSTFCSLFNIDLCPINTCAQCFQSLTRVHKVIEELKKQVEMAKTEILNKIVRSYRSSPTTTTTAAAAAGAYVGAGTRAGTSRANEQTNMIRKGIVKDTEDSLNNKNNILGVEDDSETDYESEEEMEVPVPRNLPRISSSVSPRTPPRTPPRNRSLKRGILKSCETSPSLLSGSLARKKVSFNTEPHFKPISSNNMEKIGQMILECQQRPSIVQIDRLPCEPSNEQNTININSAVIRRFIQREERSLRLKNLGIKKKFLFSSSNTLI